MSAVTKAEAYPAFVSAVLIESRSRIRRCCTISNRLTNYNTRTATPSREAVLVKRRRDVVLVWLWMSTLFAAVDPANAGPFHDFFRNLRSAVGHPKPTPRPHRSHKEKTAPSDDPSKTATSGKPNSPQPGQPDIRWAKAGSVTTEEKPKLPYGTPVAGKPGLVTSPFAPDAGYVQVLGFPPGTPVEDPYTGKVFLTP